MNISEYIIYQKSKGGLWEVGAQDNNEDKFWNMRFVGMSVITTINMMISKRAARTTSRNMTINIDKDGEYLLEFDGTVYEMLMGNFKA